MLYSVIHFFLLIANSPSFWCGLRLTHQNYARHPRQLVRSCLQLDRNIRRHKGWADCLGSRKSAQLCLAPSHHPPAIVFDLISSLKSLLIQIPPLPDHHEISTEHSKTDLLLDQVLQIQHLGPLACWQHVVQDLGGEKNENEDQGRVVAKCYQWHLPFSNDWQGDKIWGPVPK